LRSLSPSPSGGEDEGAGIELCICDDGRGFDPDCVPPDRLGLSIIRERAQAIGAELTVESRPGCGTQIAVVWKGGE
jgi:signal transduction histidine kinase